MSHRRRSSDASLSASARRADGRREKDRRRSQEAGFNVHMIKPVDFAALTKVLAESSPG
jgi:hypothetical protein